MVKPLEIFLGTGVGVSELERGAVLLEGGGAVALPFEKLAQEIVNAECGRFLDRPVREIAMQQAHAERKIAAGAENHAGAIHQRGGMIDGGGFEVNKSLVHFVEPVGVAQEASQIEPPAGAGVAGGNLAAQFALGPGGIF